MTVVRSAVNPILQPSDVKPSSPGMEIIGVFNPGVATFENQTILLVRVAERPIATDSNLCLTPVYDAEAKLLVFRQFAKSDASIDFSDARVIHTSTSSYLTSLSHFRIARSQDGERFIVEDEPAMFPANRYETFGIEDPRITQIGDTYYITYSAISELGIVTSLARTQDFCTFERLGNIFHPDNKDVALLPNEIDGSFFALHRPSSSHYGRPEIWIAESTDLLNWGNHRHLLGVRPGHWDSARVGASTVPFLTPDGWVEIYHGANADNRYCLGAILLDSRQPWKVIARSEQPFMVPEASFEVDGFFGEVIFSCGLIVQDGIVRIYYGASDSSIGYAQVELDYILEHLGVSRSLV